MRRLIPPAGPAEPEVGEAELAGLYAYPQDAGPGRPGPDRWLRANFVESADGGATLAGRSNGLSGRADRQVFGILRSLADVIVVGIQTARAERYNAVKPEEVLGDLRAGRTATPPIAVISRRLDVDPQAPLLTTARPDARTILITTELAPAGRRAELAKNADVIVAGSETVDLKAAMAMLAARGHRRVLTEGGPHLMGEWIRAGLLDELCLTISPVLAGPVPGRIVASLGLDDDTLPADGTGLTLGHVLEDDGFLLCRYTLSGRDRR
jgi:riboflavin biosynthesis pyrimidine reductase